MLSIMQGDGRKVHRMVYEVSCSSKLGVCILQLNLQFMHNILDITRSGLFCDLIFNMKRASNMLYMGNPISSSFSSPSCHIAYF